MPRTPRNAGTGRERAKRSTAAESGDRSARRRPIEQTPPSARGPDRMPPLPRDTLSNAQKAAAEELEAGPRGALVGPFIPALRSPEFMTRLQRLGHYLRYDNALGPRLTELAILLTAREWSQEFEWAMHLDAARGAGISGRTIESIALGRRPARLTRDEAVVYDFLHELGTARAVGDQTYERAIAAFGEAGVVDLIGVAGYYAMLAMILNVARTPVPADSKPVKPPLP